MPLILRRDWQHGAKSLETYRLSIPANEVFFFVKMSPRDYTFLRCTVQFSLKDVMGSDNVRMVGNRFCVDGSEPPSFFPILQLHVEGQTFLSI